MKNKIKSVALVLVAFNFVGCASIQKCRVNNAKEKSLALLCSKQDAVNLKALEYHVRTQKQKQK